MALKGVVGNFRNFYLLALLLGLVSPPATAANCSNLTVAEFAWTRLDNGIYMDARRNLHGRMAEFAWKEHLGHLWVI